MPIHQFRRKPNKYGKKPLTQDLLITKSYPTPKMPLDYKASYSICTLALYPAPAPSPPLYHPHTTTAPRHHPTQKTVASVTISLCIYIFKSNIRNKINHNKTYTVHMPIHNCKMESRYPTFIVDPTHNLKKQQQSEEVNLIHQKWSISQGRWLQSSNKFASTKSPFLAADTNRLQERLSIQKRFPFFTDFCEEL
ncbi:hypothetical protein Hanom_Chr15g01339471 [Helianthus anomalus]